MFARIPAEDGVPRGCLVADGPLEGALDAPVRGSQQTTSEDNR
jgi:hypothetical protein